MLKLIQRDLFIYQGKNIYIIPVYAVGIIAMLNRFGAASGFSNAVLSISLCSLVMTIQLTFTCDDMSKFNRFLRATPVSVKTIVVSRYASCLLSAIMGIVMILIVGFIPNAASFFIPALEYDMVVNIDGILLCLILVMTICAILLPALFKFDYVNVKYPLMFLLLAAITSVPVLISDAWVERLSRFMSMMSTGMYLGLTILSIGILWGSAALSVSVFRKKEV